MLCSPPAREPRPTTATATRGLRRNSPQKRGHYSFFEDASQRRYRKLFCEKKSNVPFIGKRVMSPFGVMSFCLTMFVAAGAIGLLRRVTRRRRGRREFRRFPEDARRAEDRARGEGDVDLGDLILRH